MGSWEEMPRPVTSHDNPYMSLLASLFIALRAVLVAVWGDSASLWTLMDPADQQLVQRPDSPQVQSPRRVTVSAACCRQDRCPLPHPSHKHFASGLINSRLSGISLFLTWFPLVHWASQMDAGGFQEGRCPIPLSLQQAEMSLASTQNAHYKMLKKPSELTLILLLNMLSQMSFGLKLWMTNWIPSCDYLK